MPANLRGLHAWLAMDQELAVDVIAADPMGVIEYGDTDNLSVQQAGTFIGALCRLAERNPRFRGWESYRFRGIAKPELVDDLCLLIASPTTQYGLRLLVLEAIHHTAITGVMANPLRRLVLNSSEPFGTRNAALLALIDSRAVNDLTETCESLRAMADDNSTRLVMENAHKIGIDNFSDNQLVETIFAETQISLCTIPRKNHVHVIGVFYMFCKHLPDHRLDDFLDKFSDFADALIDRKAWHDGRETWRKYSDVSGVAIELITRRVKLGGLDATRLWRWLKPYEGGSGYHQRELDAFAKALTDDHTLRRGVQQHVLLETPGTSDVWQRHGTLIQCSSAFAVSLDDALYQRPLRLTRVVCLAALFLIRLVHQEAAPWLASRSPVPI